MVHTFTYYVVEHGNWYDLLSRLTTDLRGYTASSLGASQNITLALLASDLEFLLVYLSITRVHAVVGLGLGASVALTYLSSTTNYTVPISSFVGMSFRIPSSESMPEHEVRDKWNARIALAQRVGMQITGDKAVARWFSADARGSPEWDRVREMVAQGSAEWMRSSSQAAVESVSLVNRPRDMKTVLENLAVPALFLCGAGDGMLPEEMELYPELMKSGRGEFRRIDRGARLACCERAEYFAQTLDGYLTKSLGLS
ncbi:hypothetical protein MMC10_000881 [Thelotrema lepadinum]|nr:hypothetical protein [Thelotrema lepadinum]